MMENRKPLDQLKGRTNTGTRAGCQRHKKCIGIEAKKKEEKKKKQKKKKEKEEDEKKKRKEEEEDEKKKKKKQVVTDIKLFNR